MQVSGPILGWEPRLLPGAGGFVSSMATKFLLTPFSSRSCGRAAFLLCCHGNAACIHPWSCLSPSCRGPVCIPPGPACFHPWSSLPPSLVLQPLSATRLLPRGFQGALPSLRTLDKTLLEMKRGRGRRGHPRVIQSVSAGPSLQLPLPVPRCR